MDGCLVPGAVVDSIFYGALDGLSGSIAAGEGDLRQLVFSHLLGQVAGQGGRLGTQRERHLSVMGLTSLIGHIGLYDEVIIHPVLLRFFRHHHGHQGFKTSLVIGHRIGLIQHILLQTSSSIALLPVARIAEPPIGHTALHCVVNLGSLHRHTGIAQGLGLGPDGIALLVRLLVLCKLHLKCWTLIFLDTEAHAAAVGTDGEVAVQLSGGQGKLAAALAVLVGDHLLFGHYLVVGIAQLQGQLPAGHSLVVDGRPLFPHDGSHLYCLSRAIDAAVGEEAGMFVTILALIVTIAPIAVDRRTIVVVGCKSIDIGGALFVRLDQQLALLVAGFLFAAAGRVPPTAVVQSQASVRHGLPRPRIDHHIAHHVLRHGLRHDAQPRHKEQGTLWGYHGQAVTLYQIDTGGESVKQHGVFKHLPFRMLAQGDSALMTRQLRHALSDSDIVFRVVGIQLGVTMQTGTIDAHRQRGDIT